LQLTCRRTRANSQLGRSKFEDNDLALESENELLACLLEVVKEGPQDACAPIVIDEIAGSSDATGMAISVEDIVEAQVSDNELVCELRRLYRWEI
jgi:hypothetical protein